MATTTRRKKRSPPPVFGIAKTPTGISGLDEITEGGLPTGRPTLVCGAAGCGKTMLAAEFLVRGATVYGEPGVFMMFEESADELAVNMRSLGFDLDALQRQKKLALDFVRVERSEIEETGEYDLEGLFIRLGYAIDSIKAKRVVLDTIEALFAGVPNHAILRSELRRLFRWLKDRGVTAIITAESGESALTRYGLEEYLAVNGERTRTLQVLKSRGMPHSNQVREFVFSDHGVDLVDVYLFGDQVLTGTARIAHEAQVLAANDLRGRDHARRLRDLANRRKALDAQIEALNVDAQERAGEVQFEIERERLEAQGVQDRARSIAARRGAGTGTRSKNTASRKG